MIKAAKFLRNKEVILSFPAVPESLGLHNKDQTKLRKWNRENNGVKKCEFMKRMMCFSMSD